MSARWFLVSMYLIWTLGSKLILSNNQSRATLWFLQTCLIVGLPPFVNILITASLSSKDLQQSFLTRNQSFHEISFALEICAVGHELSSCTGLTVVDYSDWCFREELRRSDPINQVREPQFCVQGNDF